MKDLNDILKKIYETSPYLEWKNTTDFESIKSSPVYGEITQKGTDMLVEKFKDHFNDNTIFYDLGSGLGKMVIHIGLQYGVKKSIGIEYSKERNNGAQHLKNTYAKENDNIILIQGDILDNDLSDATIVYVDNTVFPNDIMEKIYNKLPKDCLILYKRTLWFLPKEYKQKFQTNVTERTYKDHTLMWLFKK